MSAERDRTAAVGNSVARGGGMVSGRLVPAAPADLEAVGRAVWDAVWVLARVEPADAVTVARLCRLEDEASRLRVIVAADGEVLRKPMQNSRGEVIGQDYYSHPGVASLRRIGKEAAELCDALGLSPAGRNRLGLTLLVDSAARPDALDRLREARDHRLAAGKDGAS